MIMHFYKPGSPIHPCHYSVHFKLLSVSHTHKQCWRHEGWIVVLQGIAQDVCQAVMQTEGAGDRTSSFDKWTTRFNYWVCERIWHQACQWLVAFLWGRSCFFRLLVHYYSLYFLYFDWSNVEISNVCCGKGLLNWHVHRNVSLEITYPLVVRGILRCKEMLKEDFEDNPNLQLINYLNQSVISKWWN